MPVSSSHPLRLGELLVQVGVLTEATLAEVLDAQKTDRRRLGDLLAERDLVPPRRLAQILSHHLSLPWLSLTSFDIPPALIELIPRDFALKHTLVPVYLREIGERKVLCVAMHDPTDEVALTECARLVRMKVKPMVAVTFEIRQALSRYYGAPLPSMRTAPVAPLVPSIPNTSPAVPPPTASKQVATSTPAASNGPQHVTAQMPAAKPPTEGGPPRMPGKPQKPPPPLPAGAALMRSVPLVPPPVAAPPAVAPSAPEVSAATAPPPVAPSAPEVSAATAPRRTGTPVVLLLNAPESFQEQCKKATSAIGGEVENGSLMNAGDAVRKSKPAAIVVTDDIYAFDRSGLNRLALEVDAILVVWSDDVEADQLQPLLETAFKRWERASP